ncbi:acyl-ACP desaturase [Mycolicibacterium confluentis]|uniref:Acyl-ACP desaturase n=1 Tax=Mycolicibacterium confluentis TaxID=28047 RepID=A0A7I7XSC3_9MYCO|nr:acyl-ACP desaturase [Mycolicibacterium confluentis]MCV7321359.1 acyl-ACP desaturase [Mycolicibacterium confluentis]ORV25179.1 acyl-ACP desaturase [Mycolicibacterium confluentis]BBZ32159.1 acyl-ACP desaturase [Mycolicibacterium confluentis]
MAEFPIANALTLELEPVVAENLQRHLDTAEEWFAHDYVPFEQGENFAFLGGRDWDPSQQTLPQPVVDALEILQITKDNLAGYHREIVEHFILDWKWGRFIGRWTAEEHLHAIVLRNYLVVTRNFDPTANEDVRVDHVMNKGYLARDFTQIETLVFMSFFEKSFAVFCRRLAEQIEEPVLRSLIERIALDEERHELFFRNLVRWCVDYDEAETVVAVARRAAGLQVPGADIDAYPQKVANVAESGIFGPEQLKAVISEEIAAFGLAERPELREFISA